MGCILNDGAVAKDRREITQVELRGGLVCDATAPARFVQSLRPTGRLDRVRIGDMLRLRVLSAIVLGGMCTAGCGSSTAQTVTVTTTVRATPHHLQLAEVPTSLCTMSYGGGQPSATAPSPTTATVIPSTVQPHVAAYWSPGAVVLAPRGWKCAGDVGADGSGELVVAPKGTPHMSGFNLDPPMSAPSVRLQVIPACQVCVAGFICALYPNSPLTNEYADTPCAAHDPPRQRVERVTQDTALFIDPPHVKGQGDPSGGRYSAYGALMLQPFPASTPGRTAGAAVTQITCSLPPASRDLCLATVTDQLARARNP